MKNEPDNNIIFEYRFKPEKSFQGIGVNLVNVDGLQALEELGKQAEVQVSVGLVWENYICPIGLTHDS